MTLEDAVLQAGGLLESASMVRVDVSRRIKAPNSTEEAPVEAELFTFALKDGLVVEEILDLSLSLFDEIKVRRSPGYSEQQRCCGEGRGTLPGSVCQTFIK